MAYLGGVAGWSGGGRRPLTYSLLPGQMRNTHVNVFQNYMPMTACYLEEIPSSKSEGMSKWLQVALFGGLGASFLGGIASAIWGGGGRSEGAGGVSKKEVAAEQDLEQLKTDFKEQKYSISRYSDGTCFARKNGKIVASAKTPLLLRAELDALQESPADNTPTTEKFSQDIGNGLITGLLAKYSGKGIQAGAITYDAANGKFKYNNKEYTYTELNAELSKLPDSQVSTPATTTPPETTTPAATPEVALAAAPTTEAVAPASAWEKPTSISLLSDPRMKSIKISPDAEISYANEMGAKITNAPKTCEIKDS